MTPLPHSLPATIRTIGPELAELDLEDGQSLRWPRHLLPETARPGDRLNLVAFDESSSAEERQRLARDVLHRLLRET